MTSVPAAVSRASGALAALAFAGFAALVLFLAAQPIDTPDFWFHLALGETYADEGLWPDGDPLLHTAHEDAPVQHEWLFDWVLYAVERLVGFPGLRVLHALAVAGILALVFSLFRRASGTLAAASCAAGVFLVLAWVRLVQLRPDLVSIPAAFLLYRLLLEDPERPPSWRRVAGSALLLLVWANMHSLFAIGPLLLVAALAGLRVQAFLARRIGLPEDARLSARRGRRIATALGLGLVASIANPRGLAQHLTYLTSSKESGIWSVHDEWSHFVPWDANRYPGYVSVPAWLATNAILLCFAAATLLALVRWIRRPSRESLRAADSVLLALSAAAVVAMCASIRFLWMGAFPLILLLRSARVGVEERPAWRSPTQGAFALCSLLVCVAGARTGSFSGTLAQALPPYFAIDYSVGTYPVAAVRFLQETGLAGKLFNNYTEGGFIGYWLAPRLRTFIDGRTEHYSKDVLDDFFAVASLGITRPGESFLEVLDRRDVDVFLGQGLPLGAPKPGHPRFTTAHLEGVPGWIPVFRALDQAVYLRADADNADNLARVVRYFADARVPFDPERGFDAGEIARRRPDWAMAHRILPGVYDAVRAARGGPDPGLRYLALDLLGTVYALVGAHREQVELDREACTLRPGEKAPRRRLVYGLLRLGRSSEAAQEVQALLSLDPSDPRSIVFDRVARHLAELDSAPEPPRSSARLVFLNVLPLLDGGDVNRTLRGRYGPDLPLLPRGERAPGRTVRVAK